MNARRRLVLGFAAAVTAPSRSFARRTTMARVGYLSATSLATDGKWLPAFEQGLRDLGYVDGKNVQLERRHAAGNPQKLDELALELVNLKLDVIVTYGGIDAIKKHSTSIPIVMTVHADPVRSKVIASLARPGGQVTGLSDLHGDIAPKRLELLKEASPSLTRVGVLFNPSAPVAGPAQIKDVADAAPKLGLTLAQFPVRSRGDIERAFAAMTKERIGGFTIIGEPTIIGLNRPLIVDLANRNRMPAIATLHIWVEQGLLMSYGTDFRDLWRRAATYVDKILKGAKPGDLPVEQPTRFELVVNMKTARAIGVSMPQTILIRADRVIE